MKLSSICAVAAVCASCLLMGAASSSFTRDEIRCERLLIVSPNGQDVGSFMADEEGVTLAMRRGNHRIGITLDDAGARIGIDAEGGTVLLACTDQSIGIQTRSEKGGALALSLIPGGQGVVIEDENGKMIGFIGQLGGKSLVMLGDGDGDPKWAKTVERD